MGSNSSKESDKTDPDCIDCGDYISVLDINRDLKKRENDLDETGKKLYRKATIIVANEPDYIFHNCQILIVVNGNDLCVKFYAGSGDNKYFIMEGDDGTIQAECTERSTWRITREGANSVWKVIREIASAMSRVLPGLVVGFIEAVVPLLLKRSVAILS